MGDWKRCPNCRYIRHINDDGQYGPEVCPRCNGVYEKTLIRKEKERRRRSFQAHRKVGYRHCKNCREPFSVLTNICPLCEHQHKTPRSLIAGSIAAGFALMVAVAWSQQWTDVTSPYPGVSDSHFERCITLSVEWVHAKERNGLAARDTLRIHNDWHALCSRKALRHVASPLDNKLPTTPEGWLFAINE